MRDYSVYEIEFPDGTTDEIEANLIAESMVAECDPEGRQYKMLEEELIAAPGITLEEGKDPEQEEASGGELPQGPSSGESSTETTESAETERSTGGELIVGPSKKTRKI